MIIAGRSVGKRHYFKLYVCGVVIFRFKQRYFLELVRKLLRIEKN
jgi:hypothetical protein